MRFNLKSRKAEVSAIATLLCILGGAAIIVTELFDAPLPIPSAPRRTNALDRPFVVGANYPWLNYGQDFGTSAWGHNGISNPLSAVQVEADFAQLRASGINVVRWFVLADGRSGLRLAADGQILGVDDYVHKDMRAALELARKYDIQLILVLLDFPFIEPPRFENGVRAGGRGYLLSTPERQNAFIEKVFVPLFKEFGNDDSIAAWEVINEPEWATRMSILTRREHQLSKELMHHFIKSTVSKIHEHTVHYATVGSASRRWLEVWQDTGINLFQFHYYPFMEWRNRYDYPASLACPAKPCIIGEFPTKNGRWDAEYYIEVARRQGYQGIFFWSFRTKDKYSDGTGLRSVMRWRRQFSPQKP